MKTYAEKLRDPRWQKKRLEVMERDKFSCRMCFSNEKTLHVHHMVYKSKKEPWDYDSVTLVTLCDDCHSYVESSEVKILMSRMAMIGIPVPILEHVVSALESGCAPVAFKTNNHESYDAMDAEKVLLNARDDARDAALELMAN